MLVVNLRGQHAEFGGRALAVDAESRPEPTSETGEELDRPLERHTHRRVTHLGRRDRDNMIIVGTDEGIEDAVAMRE